MPYDRNIHHRRSIRLRRFDYSLAGWYFVTICTRDREPLLLHPLIRHFVYNAWHGLRRRFPSVRLDEFIIMPNHIHGIIRITRPPPVGAQRDTKPNHFSPADSASQTERISAPDQAAPLRPAVTPRSLAAITRAFKSVTAKRINRLRGTPGAPVWQRNYYEHIIRNEQGLKAIRQYIRNNAASWAQDKHNPVNWPNPTVGAQRVTRPELAPSAETLSQPERASAHD